MSERAPSHSPEHEPRQHEIERARELEAAARERLEKAAENRETKSPEDVRKIEQHIEKEAHSSRELLHKIEHGSHDHDKHQAYNYSSNTIIPQAVIQARKQLPTFDRAMSRVIHNSKVDTVSSIGGATVARPSGLLYGSLFSLLASIGFYFVSKRYGYEYNTFIGILAFVGGFFFGLIVEMFMAGFRSSSDKSKT